MKVEHKILDAIADEIGANAILRWLVERPDCSTWSYSRVDRPYLLILDGEAIDAYNKLGEDELEP